MAQHDYVIDNSTGANVRADINSALQAIATNNSGSSAPSATFPSQFFADTSAGIMKLRNTSNNGYVNLFTLAGGVDVDAASNFNGDVTFTGASHNITFDKSQNALEFADSAELRFGTGDDFKIYHDGTNSLQFFDSQVGGVRFRTNTGSSARSNLILGTGVALYFDNSKKFETTSNGVQVSGRIDITGTGTRIAIADNGKIILGNSNDLQIYHDGTNSYLRNETGELRVQADDFRVRNNANNQTQLYCNAGAQVELYHDNSKKLETVSNGINVTGHVRPISSRDGVDDIGGSSQRWDDIFATNSTIQTSDQKEKENISDSDLGLDFINKLSPKSFKFKGKTRTHYGLIAQDIETIITDLGKTTTQFAPLIKNTLEDGTERYGLRYTELLSPLIKAVQELSAKVAALEAA